MFSVHHTIIFQSTKVCDIKYHTVFHHEDSKKKKRFLTVNENIKKYDDDDDDDDVLSFCDTGEDSKKISRQRKIFDKLYSKRMERINRI